MAVSAAGYKIQRDWTYFRMLVDSLDGLLDLGPETLSGFRVPLVQKGAG